MVERSGVNFGKRVVGEHSLSNYGSMGFMNRPVRNRTPGGVGAVGEKPAATRFRHLLFWVAILGWFVE